MITIKKDYIQALNKVNEIIKYGHSDCSTREVQ